MALISKEIRVVNLHHTCHHMHDDPNQSNLSGSPVIYSTYNLGRTLVYLDRVRQIIELDPDFLLILIFCFNHQFVPNRWIYNRVVWIIQHPSLQVENNLDPHKHVYYLETRGGILRVMIRVTLYAN